MRPNELRKLVKECVVEVLKEDLSGDIWDKRGLSLFARVEDIYGNKGKVLKHYVDGEHLTIQWEDGKINDVHYTWIRPLNMREGFDPTSQGPNPTEENPYPKWNAHMRQLEETGGRYAQEAGAGEFDPNNFAVNEYSTIENDVPNPVREVVRYIYSICKRENKDPKRYLKVYRGSDNSWVLVGPDVILQYVPDENKWYMLRGEAMTGSEHLGKMLLSHDEVLNYALVWV